MTTEAPSNALAALADHRDAFIQVAGDFLTQTVEGYAPIEALIRSMDESHQAETAALKAEHAQETQRLNLIAATANAAAEEQVRHRTSTAVAAATAEVSKAHQGELRSLAESHEASLLDLQSKHVADTARLRLLAEADVEAAKTSVAEELSASHSVEMAAARESFDKALTVAADTRVRDLEAAREAHERAMAANSAAHERELSSAAEERERVIAELRDVHARELSSVGESHHREILAAAEAHQQELASASERREGDVAAANEVHRQELATASERHDRDLAAAAEKHQRDLTAASERRDGDLAAAAEAHQQELANVAAAHAQEMEALKQQYEFKLSGAQTMWLAADANRVQAEASLAAALRAIEEMEAKAPVAAELEAILFPEPAAATSPDLSTELAATQGELAAAVAEVKSLRQGMLQPVEAAGELRDQLAAAESARGLLAEKVAALAGELAAAREALTAQKTAEPTAASLNAARAETRKIVRLVAEANPDIRLTEAADLVGAALQGQTANAFVRPLPVLMGSAA